jgi:hypothetical protein
MVLARLNDQSYTYLSIDRFHYNNTYKALRIISEHYNFHYAVWCTNEHELYDLKVRRAPLFSRSMLSIDPRPTPANFTIFFIRMKLRREPS